MAKRLKSYGTNLTAKAPEPPKPAPSGVACSEKDSRLKCKGEMMWREPRIQHPELPELARADCPKCGWFGWV